MTDSTGAADPTWILRLDAGTEAEATDALTVGVKDCIDVAGFVTTAGSPVIAESTQPAERDAACLDGFRAAGARIVGKTNLHELCFGSSGVNPHYGTPPNPLDARRIPGGSSSGSAVAVATGQVDVALGTDTAGSIRNPAACCGIVGLKPTFGVASVVGTRPLAPSLDTIGVFGRTVADVAVATALLDDSLLSIEPQPWRAVGRLRLAGTDPTIDAAVDSALLAAGMDVTVVEVPGWDEASAAAVTILYAEALQVNAELWENHRDRLGDDLRLRFTAAERIGARELGEAREIAASWRDELEAVVAAHGALVAPTMLTYPARLGAQSVPPNPAAPAVSLSGHPVIALPVPSGGLLPASIQIIAPLGREDRALAVAASIEAGVAAA